MDSTQYPDAHSALSSQAAPNVASSQAPGWHFIPHKAVPVVHRVWHAPSMQAASPASGTGHSWQESPQAVTEESGTQPSLHRCVPGSHASAGSAWSSLKSRVFEPQPSATMTMHIEPSAVPFIMPRDLSQRAGARTVVTLGPGGKPWYPRLPMRNATGEVVSAAPRQRTMGRAELFATVFTTGAVIMTVEIVGTRIVGPVFGVGLFVWSALLAVTLGALALGYYTGGRLADRTNDPRLLGSVIAVAGVLLGLVPLVSRSVLRASESLGPRGGALASAAVLFAPALVALGMTGPIAVKLATTSLTAAGRSIGAVYAVSTAGSLMGTLLIGFIAIPAFDANAILGVASATLLVVGGGALAWRGRPWSLALLFWPAVVGNAPELTLPSGFSLQDKSQSLHGLVEVILDANRGVRFLRSDHSLLGAEYVADGSSAFGFVYVLEAARYFRPHARDAFNIGLGTGVVPRSLAKRGLRVDVVEIDPAVVRFAQQYFGFSTTGDIIVDDARTVLQRTDRRYDLVIHDTFTGGTTPEHLLSLEVVERIRGILRAEGVLALNFVGFYEGPEAEATVAVARTLRAVFRNTRAYRDRAPDPTKPVGNIIFFASDGSLDLLVPEHETFDSEAAEKITRSFGAWQTLQHVPDGPVITDARNPLARLQLPIAEAHFKSMNELLPADVWLN